MSYSLVHYGIFYPESSQPRILVPWCTWFFPMWPSSFKFRNAMKGRKWRSTQPHAWIAKISNGHQIMQISCRRRTIQCYFCDMATYTTFDFNQWTRAIDFVHVFSRLLILQWRIVWKNFFVLYHRAKIARDPPKHSCLGKYFEKTWDGHFRT